MKNCGIIIIIVGISQDFLLVQCQDIIAFILGYLNNKSGSTANGQLRASHGSNMKATHNVLYMKKHTQTYAS